jgi:type III secretory pathway component EscV
MLPGAARFAVARRADLALTLLVVAIVGMMVVPLPTPLIDLLIAANLGLGVLLVATALYLREASAFGAFPTVLLLATLYRLALNVSSTRLILLQADAGRVIEAFGKFVVRGDYLVGALVFLVLTIVQFLVIARGAERVAEVGARFSLDALPGKQMAIDAELRAGSLSAEAARARRAALERESQLYGAMDGAMKFVKGDAIAGIVITLVNFIGGVLLGVTARGLTIQDSLTTYGLLTIGDGLVTQIPALLCATSAGLVVTRVASDQPDGSLGTDIARQLFSDPRVLFTALLLLALLAVVPGLPAWPFALMALTFAGLFVQARRKHGVRARPLTHAHSQSPELLSIELGPELAAELVAGEALSPRLEHALTTLTSELERDLGVHLPEAQVKLDQALSGRGFRVSWRELRGAHVPAESDPCAAISAHVRELARRHADDLLSVDQVQHMLHRLEAHAPALVRLTVPQAVSVTRLAQVLRLLVREGVSVRWLAEILETLASEPRAESRAEVLAEAVRRRLARRISAELAPEGTLHTLRLSPELDEAITDALRREGDHEWLALAPDLARDITDAVRAAHTRAPRPHALVVSAPLRRHVRALVADAAPLLPIVSPHELSVTLRLEHSELIGP